MITCTKCGTVHHTTVYSTCYICDAKLPVGGSVRPPSGMQADGRTVIRPSDELAQ